jgi:hypothetical protein
MYRAPTQATARTDLKSLCEDCGERPSAVKAALNYRGFHTDSEGRPLHKSTQDSHPKSPGATAAPGAPGRPLQGKRKASPLKG